jgi:hypothetical protein
VAGVAGVFHGRTALIVAGKASHHTIAGRIAVAAPIPKITWCATSVEVKGPSLSASIRGSGARRIRLVAVKTSSAARLKVLRFQIESGNALKRRQPHAD